MAETLDIPAWIALFLGLYSLAAAVGELRAPGSWTAILRDAETNAAARYLIGFVVLVFGAAIYLVSPWRPGDWLAVAVTVMAGLAVLEGLAILAFPQAYLAFARRLISTESSARGWAWFALLFGLAAIAAGLVRLL